MLALLSLGSISVAHAVEGDSTDGEWKYSLAPLFLWAQGIEGTSAIGPVSAPFMSYDYDNGRTGFDRYAYDATQQGPLMGLNIHW